MAAFIDWPGVRQTYRYWFLDGHTDPSNIKSESGNYMFVKPQPNGWVPIYIGIADNLRNRIPGHERWNEAVRLGATRVMAHTNGSGTPNDAEEQDLIARWNPPLNVHHRTTPLRKASLLGG